MVGRGCRNFVACCRSDCIVASVGRINVITVAVTAADGSQLSTELSQSLLTRLGSLQAAKTNKMRLFELDRQAGGRPT